MCFIYQKAIAAAAVKIAAEGHARIKEIIVIANDNVAKQAVTEGKEAMGSALVKLRADGKLYAGTGISTDIMGASIRAYLSAVNKIVFEQMA